MNRRYYATGIASVSALALQLAMPTQAWAQDTEATQKEADSNEIVVTAQRREENLQDVPVAVTAISAQKLADAQVSNVSDLSSLAPNLTSYAAAGGNRIPILNIRGVVAGNGAAGVDNQIGIYIDGIYLGNFFGAMQDVADLERVEVLRGPQGTLFGRNSTGGAINFITVKPSGELGGKVTASIGNYDARRLRARIELPSFGGLALQATFAHTEQDGYVRNLGGGTTYDWTAFTGGRVGQLTASEDLGGENFDAVRLAARYTGVPGLTLDYAYDWSEGRYSNEPVQVLGVVSPLVQTIFDNSAANGAPVLVSTERLSAVNNELSTPSVQKNQSHTFTAEYELSDTLTVKSLSNFRTVKTAPTSNQLDGAGGLVYNSGVFGNPAPEPAVPAFLLGISPAARDSDQFSSELQFSYTSDRIDAIAGAYYFNLIDRQVPPADVSFLRLAPGNVVDGTAFDPTNTMLAANSRFRTRSYALFGQASFHLTDKLTVTGGLRNTWDRKLINSPSLPAAGNPFHYRDTNLDYLVNVGYDFTDDVFGYAKVNTGYLTGGLAGNANVAQEFNPEKITNYEAGLKTQFFNRALTLNLAAFIMDYRDLQFIDSTDPNLLTINAGKVQIRGFEVEASARPVRTVNLSASLGFTDVKLKELAPQLLAAQGATSLDDYLLANRPRWTASLAGDWEVVETTAGRLVLAADAQYTSNIQQLPDAAITPALESVSETGNRWLVNARAKFADIPLGNASGTFSIWSRNLLNDRSLVRGLNLGTVYTGVFRRGRTGGVEFTLEF